MKKAMLFSFILVAMLVAVGAEPLLKRGEKAELWEGFEGKVKWLMAKGVDNDSSLDAKASREFATEGKTSLKGTFKMNGKNGATFYTNAFKNKNWAAYKAVAFDVKNASAAELEVVFAVKAGKEYTWQESAVATLKPGAVVKDIRFDFYTNKLKSAASGWQFTASLKDASLINEFLLKFFGPEGAAGSVYIDNVRLIK